MLKTRSKFSKKIVLYSSMAGSWVILYLAATGLSHLVR